MKEEEIKEMQRVVASMNGKKSWEKMKKKYTKKELREIMSNKVKKRWKKLSTGKVD